MTVIWKKNGMRLRALKVYRDDRGVDRFQVQKETAQGMHGLFNVRCSEVEVEGSA